MAVTRNRMSCLSPCRPDAQLIEGGQRQQEEQQLNRELPDDIVRRQLIHNLAKHVIFSKDTSDTAAACGVAVTGLGYYCVTSTGFLRKSEKGVHMTGTQERSTCVALQMHHQQL